LVARKLAVDGVDIDILRRLANADSGRFSSQQAGMASVAKALGIHPNTVAARAKRMADGGLLTHYVALPQPNVVGISYGGCYLRVPFEKRSDKVLDEMLKSHCIFDVEEVLDGLIVWPVARDDEELMATGKRIMAFLGAKSVDWIVVASRDWLPARRLALGKMDLAILQALAADAQASMKPVAARLGTTVRTLQRHLERLRAAEAFRVYPSGHVILTGLVFWFTQCRFIVDGKERERASAMLDELIPNVLVHQRLNDGVQFLAYGDELGELAAQAERAAAIPGVGITVSAPFRRVLLSPYFADQVMQILQDATRPTSRRPRPTVV
jgi:DNA-binding Lrp family transcriptional regulator